MTDLPWEWVDEQLAKLSTSEKSKSAVKDLLATFWGYSIDQSFTAQEDAQTLGAFATLALGHAFAPEEDNSIWIEARPGNLVLRDQVRVLPDAYKGPAGVAHNGRLGVIVGLRPGEVRVRYTDGKKPNPDFVQHSPHLLEKRIS